MAGILKYWRESAALILASRHLPAFQPKQTVVNNLLKHNPEATVPKEEETLRVLLMKRTVSTEFMPNVYVFPGGMLDNSDFSKDWINFLKLSDQTQHLFSKGKIGSSIFSRSRDQEFSLVSGEVALRLAAIREMFEESGVLLARPISDLKSLKLSSENYHPLESSIHTISDQKILTEWREKVTKDASQFLPMCQEMEVVPDIWSLYEWSNWLTPTSLRSKRFDAAFFIACVDEAPQILPNKDEMDNGYFATPSSMINASLSKKIVLAPPQLYELSRLIRVDNINDLLTLAWKKSSHRVSQWMPVIYKCADGVMFSLPGDDLYPDEPDLTGEVTQGHIDRPETFAELQDLFPNQHRAFIEKGENIFNLYCNIQFTDGHILPVSFSNYAKNRVS